MWEALRDLLDADQLIRTIVIIVLVICVIAGIVIAAAVAQRVL